MSMKRQQVTCYLTLVPVWSRYMREPYLQTVRVAKVTAKKPKAGVVLRLNLDLPSAAFEPMRPVADITVETGDLEIIVEVEEPVT